MQGPQTAAGEWTHAMKYRDEGESFREAANRWSFALKDDDAHYHVLREMFMDMRFLLPGRCQSALGSSRDVTPYNCFVNGPIADSFVHGEGSIMDRAKDAATTMRMGGGIGHDFSTLRPKNDPIKKLGSVSSGSVSFMGIFDEIGKATQSAGSRRGAQMGVLRVDHPDVEEFIRAKQNRDKLLGFNISVGVTDEFMDCLAAQRPFSLRFNGAAYREVDPVELWEKIMRSSWDWAEPGVLFIDRINRENNLYYCETIAATNPCGEQPLPPYGACLLGSFNLVRYLTARSTPHQITEGRYDFDFERLRADVAPIVAALDNVPDKAKFPLPAQRQEAMSKRRMGIGVTGLANAAAALGLEYGTSGMIAFTERLLDLLAEESYMASALRAKERGSFAWYDEEKYLNAPFIRRLPEQVRWTIKKYGIRNSHLTSIAPTGTISLCADNVSSGLEPVLEHEALRKIITPSGVEEINVVDYGVQFLGVRGRLSHEVSARDHINVLCAAARRVDSAVSKTCNVDGTMKWDDFKNLYLMGWEGGAKGVTVFNKDGERGSIFSAKKAESPAEGPACEIGPDGRRECAA